MKDNLRIAVNSCFIYGRLILVSIISFISVRYLLLNLGKVDFGLYNLIGGIVVLFTFLSASMAQSSQRFISLSLGKRDYEELRYRMKAAVMLHLALGVIVAIIIQIGGWLLIKYYLDIPVNKIEMARFILVTVTIGTFFTIQRVPYDALLMAYENILFVSIIQTGYSVFRFIGILTLAWFTNRLEIYAILMAALSGLYLIVSMWFTKIRYKEAKPEGSVRKVLKEGKEMASFTGIYIIGTFATTLRDQGMPLILNSFYGVVINAATGIATQINGMVSQFSSTIGTAIRPQLIKSAGSDNKDRMAALSYAACKYPSLCVVLFSVPLIVGMGYIQQIWLKNVPEYAVVFSQIILVGAFMQQLSLGLTGGIDASGEIKFLYYTTAVLKLIALPLCWLCLKLGLNVALAYLMIVASETFCATVRLQQAGRLDLISLSKFIKTIVIPIVLIYVTALVVSYIIWSLMPKTLISLIGFTLLSAILTCALIVFIGLTSSERQTAKSGINTILNKLKIRNIS